MCLYPETLILTSASLKQVKDLVPGDQLSTEQTVLDITKSKPTSNLVKLTTEFGPIFCTPEQEILVSTNPDDKNVYKTASSINAEMSRNQRYSVYLKTFDSSDNQEKTQNDLKNLEPTVLPAPSDKKNLHAPELNNTVSWFLGLVYGNLPFCRFTVPSTLLIQYEYQEKNADAISKALRQFNYNTREPSVDNFVLSSSTQIEGSLVEYMYEIFADLELPKFILSAPKDNRISFISGFLVSPSKNFISVEPNMYKFPVNPMLSKIYPQFSALMLFTTGSPIVKTENKCRILNAHETSMKQLGITEMYNIVLGPEPPDDSEQNSEYVLGIGLVMKAKTKNPTE